MSNRMGVRPLGLLLVVVVVLLLSPASRAQDSSEEPKGTNSGNYNVRQAAEFGYRQGWINGNQETYGTFVNLGSGPRLLNYNLDMRSLNHQGLLFDNLRFSNFGYGGDPDNVSRLRVQKNKSYDFSVVFRRHKNFWNYNMLANPLNPVPIPPTGAPSSFAVTNPSFAATSSPHALYRVRRMQDYNLTLLPQSRLRFRLGYSRYVDQGPSFTSYHGTTDFRLAQNFQMTTNVYRIGVDFQFLPKTTISYDQFLEYNKQDTSDTLASLPFLISTTQFPGTVPVDMGLVWYYPPAGTTSPCAAPFLSTGYASPTCKGFLSYSRVAPTRNSMPTERLSFQSTYFRNLEMSGSASYNSSNNIMFGLNDDANEWTAPANVNTSGQVREAIATGSGNAKQVFVHANWSAIYSLAEKVRIIDSVRFDNWRNPGSFNQLATNLYATLPQVTGQTGILLPIARFSPLVAGGPTFTSICPAPYTAITCPQHGTTAAADLQSTVNATFLGQRQLSNTIQLEADFTKRFSGRIGYFYENRKISDGMTATGGVVTGATYYPGGAAGTAANDFLAARGSCAFPALPAPQVLPSGCTLNTDGSITYVPALSISADRDTETIDEQVGLAGLTLRPMDTLRINADFEFGYNNFSYTRIWPRQIQTYKIHVDYRPRTWATINGAVDIHENRDNIDSVNNLEHGRTYSFSTVLAPNSKFAYTVGYNYTDLSAQTFICFRDTVASTGSLTMTGPGGTVGFLVYTPTNAPCPPSIKNLMASNSTITLGTMAFYSNKQHFAYSDVMWKPVKRVTATVGYAGTFAGGSTVFLDPLQPGGTLAFTYQKPFASIQIDLYKGLSYKNEWNYYGYNSKTPINTSIPVTLNGTTNGTYALQPVGGPDFNGSTLMFALRYAF
jgi:hypothetical protein